MTVTALVSGGKDSVFSAYLAETQGWPVDEIVTLTPDDPESLLFHTPNLSIVALQAEAWGRPFRSVPVHGKGEAAETDALRLALSETRGPVVAGAIASSYQWSRLQRVTFELGRPAFTPLWGKDPARVVTAEIEAGLDIRFVHLAAEPLPMDWLGRRLDADALSDLVRFGDSVRPVHVAGEGGEFETLVVDAPFFGRRIELDDVRMSTDRDVGRLTVRKAHLEPKPWLHAPSHPSSPRKR
ncbi:MAG: diphthine--ammonia ligase [Thermoplasmata archaeon]